MSMDRIQFQHGLAMRAFLRLYGSESQCRKALGRARWPQGFACPHCWGTFYSLVARR